MLKFSSEASWPPAFLTLSVLILSLSPGTKGKLSLLENKKSMNILSGKKIREICVQKIYERFFVSVLSAPTGLLTRT